MSTLFVFVHGFKGTSQSLFIPLLRKRLTELGFPSASESYPNAEDPVYSEWKAVFLEQMTRNWSSQKIVLIGHSIGGYAVIHFLDECSDSDWAKSVIGVVAVGAVAIPDEHGFCAAPINWDNIRKLSPRFISLYSDDDKSVTPENHKVICEQLGSLPGFDGTIYHGYGHFQLKEAEPVTNAVLSFTK
jgi:predicted alpha/beta hydrolase family esterase